MDNDSTAGPQAAGRRPSHSPAHDAKDLLASGAPSSPKMSSAPAEHAGSPKSAAANASNRYSCPPSSVSFPAHSRSKSLADVTARHGKRLSLNFPIAPSPTAAAASSRPPSWTSTPTAILSPELPPTPASGGILVALAAQERRVLELKEELSRAEHELRMLKRHWADHEATQKRAEIRRGQPLQPLNTALIEFGGEEDEDGADAWIQQEMERKKALFSHLKTGRGTKFASGRHARSLSLLSPERQNVAPSFPQPPDVASPKEEPRKATLSRSSTASEITASIASIAENDAKGELPSIQREALIRTAKQMGSDFKDGLMTFIEDLRQATVGDEAASRNSQNPIAQNASRRREGQAALKSNRRPVSFAGTSSSSKTNKPPSPVLIDIGGSFWKEHGFDEPQANESKKVTKPPAKPAAKTPEKPKPAKDFDDSWDTWDTPNDKYAASSDGTNDSGSEPDSEANSHRTSTSSEGTLPTEPATPASSKRDSITWPAIAKFSPGHIKRTATHLMNEWEKSLQAGPSADEVQADAGLAYGSKPPSSNSSTKTKKGD